MLDQNVILREKAIFVSNRDLIAREGCDLSRDLKECHF